MLEVEWKSCKEKMHLREYDFQEESTSKANQPKGANTIREEAKPDALPQADDQVCIFESGYPWDLEINRGWAIIPEIDCSPKISN